MGQRVVVVCRDTYALVLLLHVKHQLPRDSTLPAFHAVTGCDIDNQFAEPGKVTAWKAFKQNSQMLTSLSFGELTEETLCSVEKFVCKIYEPLTEITNIYIPNESIFVQ